MSDDDSESVSREASPCSESPRPVSLGSESPFDSSMHTSVMTSTSMSTCALGMRHHSKVGHSRDNRLRRKLNESEKYPLPFAGDCGDADRTRVSRLGLQPGQNDGRQALLRMQSSLPRPEAAGLSHVLARLEVPGKRYRATQKVLGKYDSSDLRQRLRAHCSHALGRRWRRNARAKGRIDSGSRARRRTMRSRLVLHGTFMPFFNPSPDQKPNGNCCAIHNLT